METDSNDPSLTTEQWLELRKQAGLNIRADTAEVEWCYAQTFDPYGVRNDVFPEYQQVGREYFARAPGTDIWVWFGDLPQDVERKLWAMHRHKLAFPAGLPIFGNEGKGEAQLPIARVQLTPPCRQ